MEINKEHFLNFALADERIRAAYLHGSRANPAAVVDELSDWDITFVVTETASFIQNKEWLNAFGECAFVFEGLKNESDFFEKKLYDFSQMYVFCLLLKDIPSTATSYEERRYNSRIDLLLETKEIAMKSKFTAGKHIQVLFDKDDCLPNLPQSRANDVIGGIIQPTEERYSACCAGFWWFLNDVAKAIARDQLPHAHELFNSFTRPTLNQMLDWYMIGGEIPTTSDARRFKAHLPPDLYNMYTETYPSNHCFWDAIFTACRLFSITACAVGSRLGFDYNKSDEINMTDFLKATSKNKGSVNYMA
ncbi:MAG: aminoglycoside 6-adenylyltransferase [Defluviitaleaceae bacterium]|nr:aminoglycoside 6-adenylyltransferase [Defluviitaleaceae bacterium]